MGKKGMREIRKSTFREIKSSFGRFMAIFAIIALGVGFFAGLKVTKEAMLSTVKGYLDRHGFYDLRLISTLGFGPENVDAFVRAKDVESAEGSVSFDVIYRTEDGSQGVVKTYSVTEELNTLKVTAGRMPQESNECVADNNLFGKADIGSVISLADDNREEDLEHFAHEEYTIVGLVQSPLYIQYERGNTSLGTGRLAGFLYLLPEGFAADYFTEIYVRFSQDFDLYSAKYSSFMEDRERSAERTAKEEADKRYLEIRKEAEQKIADGRRELEEKKKEGVAELEKAGDELEEAGRQLEEGEAALADARLEFAEGEQELFAKERELIQARVTLSEKEQELYQGEVTITEKEAELVEARSLIDSNEVELRSAERQLADGKAELRSKSESVETMRNLVTEGRNQLEIQAGELERQKEELQNQVDAGTISGEAYELAVSMIERGEQTLAEYRTRLEELESQLAAGEEELAAAWQQIRESEEQLNSGWLALAQAKQQVADGQLALAEARREILDGKKALEEGKKELTEGEEAIAGAKKEMEEARATLQEKEAEFAEGKQEYEDGRKEYEEAGEEFERRIREAEEELEEAEEELAKLEEPEVYVLGRDTNIGYVCFENDSNIVEGIANIFPVFFFLVAALVCITTMNRMVEEQRTQIGVLKALGYGEADIMSKYMIYSGLAAVTGCIAGFFLGTWGFPKIIWFCYGIMYRADPIFYIFDGNMAAISLAVSLLCSIGTTWLSCRAELVQVAAALMRPKAPRAGRRVLLERIPFLWKRFSFLRKVSLRNIFRYKKRLFMMVVGISGCTALLVTGFGIRDSIADVAAKQFQEIQTYDIGISLKENADEAFMEALNERKSLGAGEYTCVMERNMDFVAEGEVKSIYLVAGDGEEMQPFLNLHTAAGEALAYPEAGEAVISNRLAENYHVRVGDRITLRGEDMRALEVKVSGIYENYIYNYVHISQDTWRDLMGEEPEKKTVYLNLTEEAKADATKNPSYELAADLMKLGQVSNVTVNADFMERIGNMMKSLDIIVAVVILCAAGLAFIVLYNLTNINITERIREIATIKVLGFYKKETAAYVFRENTMLTALGMAVGLVLGNFLHSFVMNEIRIDMISFDICIKPVSYLYSGVLTLVFAWCVNKTMGGRLEAISMTESLKSVD